MKSQEEIVQDIIVELPRLASKLVREHQDMSRSENKVFAENPDDPAQHETHWHDFGIITHSKKFLDALQTDVPNYFIKWGLKDQVDTVLSKKIDGRTKWELLQITALLHDVGKFTARKKQHGFKNHEVHSGKLLRTDLYDFLTQQSLTPRQIEYIAICAERHFELGKLRRKVKRRYSLEFTKSEEFQQMASGIMTAYPEVSLEIGLIFLADSLAKTEKPNAQQPTNVDAVRMYLQLWNEGRHEAY